MTPTLAEVRAWMRASGKGYAAASQHFGVPEADLRALAGKAPKAPKLAGAPPVAVLPPPVERPPADELEDYLAGVLKQVEADLVACRQAEKYREVAPLLAHQRATAQALADLRARRVTADPPADETPVQRLRRYVAGVEQTIAQAEARPARDEAALAAMHLRREGYHRQLAEALLAEQQVPKTVEELREEAGRVVDGWPDELLEVALRAYAERQGARLVLVYDGDRKAELTDSGWRSVG